MIATLSDIHGNLAALDAVLAEVPDEAEIVVCGDIAAGGPQPREVVERLRSLGERVHWVRGNVDRGLQPGHVVKLENAEALAQAREMLGDELADFVGDLPATFERDGVLYCHATPWNDLDIFTERASDETLLKLFRDLAAHTIVCGHTHRQFDRTVNGRRVINAGSVGQPVESAPGAYWLLDLEPRHTSYPGAAEPPITAEQWLDILDKMEPQL